MIWDGILLLSKALQVARHLTRSAAPFANVLAFAFNPDCVVVGRQGLATIEY